MPNQPPQPWNADKVENNNLATWPVRITLWLKKLSTLDKVEPTWKTTLTRTITTCRITRCELKTKFKQARTISWWSTTRRAWAQPTPDRISRRTPTCSPARAIWTVSGAHCRTSQSLKSRTDTTRCGPMTTLPRRLPLTPVPTGCTPSARISPWRRSRPPWGVETLTWAWPSTTISRPSTPEIRSIQSTMRQLTGPKLRCSAKTQTTGNCRSLWASTRRSTWRRSSTIARLTRKPRWSSTTRKTLPFPSSPGGSSKCP